MDIGTKLQNFMRLYKIHLFTCQNYKELDN